MASLLNDYVGYKSCTTSSFQMGLKSVFSYLMTEHVSVGSKEKFRRLLAFETGSCKEKTAPGVKFNLAPFTQFFLATGRK